MRRAPLFLLLVAATCTSALADPPAEDVLRPVVPSTGAMYVEPHAGINFALLNGNARWRDPIIAQGNINGGLMLVQGEGETDLYNSASGIAPLFGATFGYRFTKIFGVEVDLSYDSRRTSNSGVTNDIAAVITPTDTTSQESPVDKNFTIGADYISLGLAVTARFAPIELSIGPVYSLAQKGVVEETTRWQPSDPAVYYFRQEPDESVGLRGGVTDSTKVDDRVSLRIGAAATFPITNRIELVPRVSYDIGLTDMFTGSDVYVMEADPQAMTDPNATNQNFFLARFNNAMRLSALQFSLGVRINL